MSALPPFGLYPSRALIASQRLGAGQVMALDQPVADGGVFLFRRSLWLGVPTAAVRDALALGLADSRLALRFEPLRFTVASDSTAWFTRVQTHDDREVHFEFVWPARVVRLDNPRLRDAEAFELFRADGDAVAEQATQSGLSGRNLAPPWVGSPMVVRMARAIPDLGEVKTGGAIGGNLRAMRAPLTGQPLGRVEDGGLAKIDLQQLTLVRHSHVVPSLQIDGVPTSPRLRLSLEARAGQPELLLWQALQPGAQGALTLPAGALADEWAGALEQLRSQLEAEAPPSDASALLRLDIESDEPCRVVLQQAVLALDAERELLAEPARFDFDGSRRSMHTLPLAPPPGVQGLRLAGRARGEGGADPGSSAVLPAGQRHGLLLSTERRVQRRAELTAPLSLAGLSLAWQPLTERIAGRLRLSADGGNGRPAASRLVELDFALDTPEAALLALRFAPLDLQPQPLWIDLSLNEGSGLWLADPAQPPATGQLDSPGGGTPQPLGVAPVFGWLPAAPPGSSSAARTEIGIGFAVLATPQPGAGFAVDCPPIFLPALASQPLRVTSGAAGSVTLESARVRVRLV